VLPDAQSITSITQIYSSAILKGFHVDSYVYNTDTNMWSAQRSGWFNISQD